MFNFNFEENKTIIMAIIGVIIACIAIYYLHERQTKKVLHSELKKIFAAKKRQDYQIQKKNIAANNFKTNIQDETQEDIQEDMDSYVDPIDDNSEENNDTKLNQSNIMMRDVIDGL